MVEKSPQEMESELWAGEMGDKWNAYLDQFESMIAPAGKASIHAAQFQTGEEVIDIGCGGGITSFQIAQKVTTTGSVTGLDLSSTLIDTSTKRASELSLNNVHFIQGDASTASLQGKQFDCLYSRFGVMFFADPYAAFKHMHGHIKPGGRLNFACWGPVSANPWVSQLMSIAKKYVELPPTEPNAPGPFAFNDSEYVTDILTKASFSNIECKAWNGDQYVGGAEATPEIAAQFLMEALFMGDLLKHESEAIKNKARNDLVELFKTKQAKQGIVFDCNIWLVSANA